MSKIKLIFKVHDFLISKDIDILEYTCISPWITSSYLFPFFLKKGVLYFITFLKVFIYLGYECYMQYTERTLCLLIFLSIPHF